MSKNNKSLQTSIYDEAMDKLLQDFIKKCYKPQTTMNDIQALIKLIPKEMALINEKKGK